MDIKQVMIKYQKVSQFTNEKLLILIYQEHILASAKIIIELLELDEAQASNMLSHVQNNINKLITTRQLKDLHNILNSKPKQKPKQK